MLRDDLMPLKPLGTVDEVFEIDCVSNKETRQAHLDAALKRNLPRCIVRKPRKGKVAIVATGPSVTDYVDMLKEWDGEIWGINGAFAWMRHRGIEPTAFIGIDPEWFLVEYLNTPPDIYPPMNATYYLASQVHPAVFDHLKHHNVRLWFHADRELRFPQGVSLVPGGSSCLGRAPYLACMLGWGDVHLFGGDSSFTHKTHVYGGKVPEKDCGLILVENSGRVFRTTKSMLTQATDMVEIVQNFPGTITVHGDGLMPTMVQEAKDSGAHDWLIAQETAELKQMNHHERRILRAEQRRMLNGRAA